MTSSNTHTNTIATQNTTQLLFYIISDAVTDDGNSLDIDSSDNSGEE